MNEVVSDACWRREVVEGASSDVWGSRLLRRDGDTVHCPITNFDTRPIWTSRLLALALGSVRHINVLATLEGVLTSASNWQFDLH